MTCRARCAPPWMTRLPDYAARAQRALAPFSREAVDRLVAEQLLPRLLA